jgi:N-acetyltransferase
VREESFRTPLVLRGQFVELVPLTVDHAPELAYALRDPETTRWFREPVAPGVAGVEASIRTVLDRQGTGTDLAFAVVLRATGRAIGTTRYLRIDRRSDLVEVGGTVYDPQYWRTPVNTESKFLLFRHAFEQEKAHRVQLQTDLRNERSQRAIERLGAVPEARLRDDVLRADGSFRTSVYYSILENEWPTVKQRLGAMLARSWTPPPPTSGPKVVPLPPAPAPGGSSVPAAPARPALRFEGQSELRGRWVHLMPLSREALPGLIQAGADPEIWTYMRIRHGDSPREMEALVEELLEGRAQGEVHPYVVRVGAPERTVGIMRYLDIDRKNQWVEIGTWLSRWVWRTPVNTEAKYLLLRNAFEAERAHRVQLKTDLRNLRSQEAILRLGAVPEGIMRDHYQFMWGGYRTSLFYSILESEWPEVRQRLEAQLARPYEGPVRPLAPAA